MRKKRMVDKILGIVIASLMIGSMLGGLPSTVDATSTNTDRIIYYFDPANGDVNLGYNGNSPWGVSLDTLPVQNGYHLPAREGYMSYEDEYDVLADETEYGFGYYINMLWPDGIHWNWDGSYQIDGFRRPPGLWWDNGKVVKRDPNPAKVLVYSPWTGQGCIAVVGDSGPAPWTGRQAGVSDKVFDALGLPESHTRHDGTTFDRGNPNPRHAPSSNTNPEDYPVIMYANNPYWVEFSWADQDALPGLTPISGCPVGYPVIDDDPTDNLYWDVPFNYFGNWYEAMGGFHSGEDWNLVGGDPNADLNKPVYAISDGTVAKVSNLGNLGYLIGLEHNAPPNHLFKIPGKEGHEHGQSYWYKTEYVTKFYSIYIHVIPCEGIVKGAQVEKGDLIGRIMDPGGGPHLHFEIRHPDAKNSVSWSLVGDPSNWTKKDGKYTGYYLDIQKMANAGVRNPREFILANSIFAGLQWLRNRQNSEGAWVYSGRITQENVGLTSMAAACFLNHRISESDPTVEKAINWILSRQNPDGSISEAGPYYVYDTSLAILALVATQNPDYNDEIEDAACYLIRIQNYEDTGYPQSDRYYGGWSYWPEYHWADLSNSQFALLALHYAESVNPDDILVPQVTWDRTEIFLQRCQNREASNPDYNFYDDGGFIYLPGCTIWGGGRSYASITTTGLWGFFTVGLPGDDPRVEDAIGWLESNYYVDRNYPIGELFLYYYLYGLAKACVLWNIPTIAGHDWYAEMSQELINRQEADGHWPGTNPWEEPDNVATCWALLALESKLIPTGTGLSFEADSPVDLHVYDPEGRHVGINYTTEEVEIEIPGANYSGPGTEPQIINISNPIAGTYNVKLVGIAADNYTYTVRGLINGRIVSEESYTSYITPGEVHESTSTVSAIAGAITVETNTLPIADADGPYIGFVGEPITFNGTASYDPDGTIVKYEWDLDDDGQFDDATGVTQTITFYTSYSGEIHLRVIDDDGNIDTDTTTLTVSDIVPVTIDIDPDTLNLKSKGKWITCYIELPLGHGYDVEDINVSTILLNDVVPAEDHHPTNIGDYDNDGILDLMVKFNRQAVQGILEPGDNVAITVAGKLQDGMCFEGIDYIRVK